MSLSPVGQGSGSPDVTMPSIRMKLDDTFATMQQADGKSTNMKIFARVRPMLQREEDDGYKECVGVIDDQVVRAIVPSSSAKFKNTSQNGQEIYEDFTYSKAFGPETGQFAFFRLTIMDIMQGFIEGQNCLVFSYGITNSGKTFTLQGNDANPGVIPLAMRLFFASIKHNLMDGISVKPDKFADIRELTDKEVDKEVQLREQLIQQSEQESINKTNASGSSTKSFRDWCDCFEDDYEFETDTTLPPEEMKAAQSALYMKELSKKSADEQEGVCSIWVSFVEIYNEYIYDLLQPITLNRPKLTLAEDQNSDVYVKGAREICISSSDDALKLLSLGRKNLRTAATKLNYQSSRSHCIFTVKVVRLFDAENGRVNRISFCDLAGSERAAKSQTTGMHLKEAGYINTSILVLGKCLEQLRQNQISKDKKMIPFRESKLTRLFSGHFLGKGRAVMIANASPCEYTFDETLNVLRFSALLKTLKLNDSYLSAVSSSLQNITNQWSKSRARLSDISHNESSDSENSLLEDIQEREELIDKLLDLADSLRSNLEKEKKEKAELEFKLRAEICQESAQLSDEYLARQKSTHNSYVASLNEMHKKRVADLEEMYEKRISQLMSQLQECESSTEESSMSINEGNSTLDVEDANVSKVLFASPAVAAKAENEKFLFSSPLAVKNPDIGLSDKCDAVNSPVFSAPLQSERLSSYENCSPMDEIKSLQESLGLVTVELQTAKADLEQCSAKLKTAQTEAADALKVGEDLRLKLQEAEAASFENAKEIDLLKNESLKKDTEVQSLIKEKDSLEENILFLTKEITAANSEIYQLKNDQIKTKVSHNAQIEQFQQKIAATNEQYKDLSQKLEDCNENLIKETARIVELESKCTTLNDDKTKLDSEKKKLEEEIACLLKQSDLTVQAKSDLFIKLENKNIDLLETIKKLEEKCAMLADKHETALKEQDSNTIVQLESTMQQLEEQKLQNIMVEEKFSAANVQLESTLQQLEEHKLKNITLEEKSTDANVQLESTIQQLEEHKLKNVTLEKKYSGVNVQLESTLKQLEEQKLKNITLEEKCSDLSSRLEKTLQDLEEETSKIGNLEKQIEGLDANLVNMNNVVSELKSKVSTLESECSSLESECTSHKNNHAELLEDYMSLEEKFGSMKEKLGTKEDDSDLKSELEKIKTECDMHKNSYDKVYVNYQAVETAFAALTKDIEALKLDYEALKEEKLTEADAHSKYVKELLEQAVSYTNEVEDLKKKLDDTQIKATSYEKEIQQLKDKLEEISAIEKEAMDNIAMLEKDISEKENRIKELTDAVEIQENSNAELKNEIQDIESYKHEIANLKEELEKAKLMQEQIAKLEKISSQNEEAMKNYAEKIAELEKSASEKEYKIEELSGKVQDLENCKTDLETKEIDIAYYKEEITNIKSELATAKLLKEQSDLLCENLQMCEVRAYDKTKMLESSAVKSRDEIKDLKRQIKEKNESICQLEKALCDRQNQVKDMDVKLTKLVAAKRQDAARIEQVQHQKKLLETEIYQLKKNVQQVNLLDEEELSEKASDDEASNGVPGAKKMANNDIEAKHSVASKGRKKRSFSDANKETDENVEDKENAKKTNKVQTKKQSKETSKTKANTEENNDLPKRRRVLRAQQVPVVQIADDSFEIKQADSDDDDYAPKKKPAVRNKKINKVAELPKQRTSRRKLQETENMSPVKKAMQFVGSKIRSVAQSASNMASPRLTRGRRKLFNADAAEPKGEPKWRP